MRAWIWLWVAVGCQPTDGKTETDGAAPNVDGGVDPDETDETDDTDTDTTPVDSTTPVDPGDCDPGSDDAGAVEIRPECAGSGPSVVDPWAVIEEWTFTDGGEAVVSPVVGQLTDDNGDGVIDDLDLPDVAFTSYSDFSLYLVSGDGTLICSSPDWDPDGGVIVADVDGDGENEVVGAEYGADYVRAVDGACNPEWTSAERYDLGIVVTTAADLDADGDVEVIADVAVVDGRTGAPITTLAPDHDSCLRAPFTGDIDLDGQLEVMLGNTVFSAAGDPLWSAPGAGVACFGAVANLDGDAEGEIVLSFGQEVGIYEHDGTPVWQAALTMPNPGPPCAGDVDGDGVAEVVVPHGLALTVFEADGALKWEVPIDDVSGSAACSVFDVDGDGAYEVLHADERAMRIYDGRTGVVRFEQTGHRSVTFFESPTVADLDGDGAAEVIVASSSFPLGVNGGITVYGHDGAGWPEVGTTWGLHDYSAANQLPGGGIPQAPPAPWLDPALFRGQPTAGRPGAANLVAEVTGICATSCAAGSGVVRVAVQVANDGGGTAGESRVSVWTVDPASGDERRRATAEVPVADAGSALASLVLEVPVEDWTGDYVVRVDDEGGGTVEECDEGDNEVRGSAAVCP